MERWHQATVAGDVVSLLRLMAEDIVVLTADRPPLAGRRAFEKELRALLTSHRVYSACRVQEIQVCGNLGYCWSTLNVHLTPRCGGRPLARLGSALSIWRKRAGGAWLLVRDASLLAPAA